MPDTYQEYKENGFIGKNDFYLPSKRIIIPIWWQQIPIYWIAWDPYCKNNNSIKYIKPKNINTPLIYNKGNKGPVYIVEGIFDYLSMVEADLNVICTLGNRLKLKYINRLKKIKDIDVIIAYDNDQKDDGSNPGLDAAYSLSEELWPEIKAKIIKCPINEDVNDLFKKCHGNKNLFLNKIASLESEETILERYAYLVERANGHKKNEVAKKIYPLIRQLNNKEIKQAEKLLQVSFGGEKVISIDEIHRNVLSANINENKSIESWSDPIPLGQRKIKKLPADILPEWAYAHIKSLSDFTQTPIDMSLLLFLSTLSTALAKKAVIEVREGYTEPLIIWTCTVLPPANRKSAVFKGIVKPILDYENKSIKEETLIRKRALNKKDILDGKLKKMKKDIINCNDEIQEEKIRKEIYSLEEQINNISIPVSPRLVASDITTEKLAQLMSENQGRISILSPEGDIFYLMGGRYSKETNFENYKKGWTGGETIRDDRMGRKGTYVRNPALTLGITVQPQIIKDLKNKNSFKGEGILGRFLFAIPESPVGYRLTGSDIPQMDKEAEKVYNNYISLLLSSVSARVDDDCEWIPHKLVLNQEALKIRDEFEAVIEKELRDGGRLSNIPDWGGKLVGNITRIAGLLHIADQMIVEISDYNDLWDKPINASVMGRAAKLGEYLIDHALEIYNTLGYNPENKKILYVLQRIKEGKEREKSGDLPKGKNKLDTSVLLELCRGKTNINKENLQRIITILEDANYIKIEYMEYDGKGRPAAPIIKLNPKLDQIYQKK